MAKNDLKQDILDVSLKLFMEKGYEKTTIRDIIDALEISKGGFYHYFDSKEDLLEMIAINFSRKAIRIIDDIASKQDLNPIEKLNEATIQISEFKSKHQEKYQELNLVFDDEKNVKLQKSLFNKVKNEAVNSFQKIIEEGIEKEYMNTSNPRELAELLIYINRSLNSSIKVMAAEYKKGEVEFDELIKKIEEKTLFYEEVFSKILEVKKGKIKYRDPYIKRFKRAYINN